MFSGSFNKEEVGGGPGWHQRWGTDLSGTSLVVVFGRIL